ncbi:MAG: helix-turn-helix transcriptional regulator [Bacteroidales bacterium]|nr:helix-turn-helix transcriptional regulator [Bacteroidales bacterium]
MNIHERISKLLNVLGYTAAQFADILGVQRSSISHLVTGRNKPSSDFLQKLLSKFPNVSAEWLLLGVGTMYKSNKENTLFDKENTNSIDSKTQVTDVNRDNIKDITIVNQEKKMELNTPPEKIDFENKIKKDSLKVVKIVFFYSDNTFSEYNPS